MNTFTTKATTAIVAGLIIAILVLPAHSQEPSGEVLKQLEKKETIPQPQEPAKPPIIQQQQKETESQRVK
ncbi:MAG: hypothetical protein HY265_07500, partial [Deltaproteobacteria bacterium]|nr:hypothetical protein [Deltaproteobacteria bacterium]